MYIYISIGLATALVGSYIIDPSKNGTLFFGKLIDQAKDGEFPPGRIYVPRSMACM